jgi:hypothetical protein
MESEGDASSDDSLSKPAPIPSHLFRNGPITLKAYRAACERTPAQPRRSRGGPPGSSVLDEDRSSSLSSNRIKELSPVQTRQKPLKERNPIFTQPRRAPTLPESIYDLPTSQGSDLNRLPIPSPEPAGEIVETMTSAPHQMQPPVKSRQAKPSDLGGNPLARPFVARNKVNKRYTTRLPYLITRKTSPMTSDSEDMAKAEPSKKRLKKRRTLPIENELMMVPALSTRESPEATVHIESDPIEESQNASPVRIKCATRTPSQSRRRPFQSIQKNLRLPLQTGSPISAAFSFRALKNTLPTTKSPVKDLAREGFDDHELNLPPRSKRKKPTAKRHQLLPSLTLINTREVKELPMNSSYAVQHETKIFSSEIEFVQHLPDHDEELCFSNAEPIVPDAELQEDEDVSALDPAIAPHVIQPRPGFKRLRRVSFRDDVQNQLTSVTAPMRESSDSEDESESFGSHDSDTESGSESEHSNREEFDEMEFAASQEIINHITELDEIEDEDLLLETANNGVNANMAKDIEVVDEPEDYLTRPGQLARMKSSGRLIEVPEDCIEVHSSSDPANSIPGYLARYHSSVTEPTSTRLPKPLKTILKSIITRFSIITLSNAYFKSFRSRGNKTISSVRVEFSEYLPCSH